jgi:hypothetical protein
MGAPEKWSLNPSGSDLRNYFYVEQFSNGQLHPIHDRIGTFADGRQINAINYAQVTQEILAETHPVEDTLSPKRSKSSDVCRKLFE